MAVVVPCRNGRPQLVEQLAALAAQQFDRPWELVVVDNDSTDGSAHDVDLVEHHAHCAVTVVHEPRRGVNRARNAGIAASSAPLVALCDADDIVAPTWLRELVAALEAGREFVGGALDIAALNSARVRRLNRMGDRHPGVWDVAPGIRAAVGANCGFTRDLWSRVGGFDDTYVSGADDTEFGVRCSVHGVPPQAVPGAVVSYRLRDDRRAAFRRAWRDDEGRARVYSQFRHLALSRRSTRTGLRTIGFCARELLLWPIVGPDRRDRAAGTIGSTVGRIVGSVRYRTYYP